MRALSEQSECRLSLCTPNAALLWYMLRMAVEVEVPESVQTALLALLRSRKQTVLRIEGEAREADARASMLWESMRDADDGYTELFGFIRELGIEIPPQE